MSENKNISSIYAQSLTPRQRKSILGAYIDYITTLSYYENVVHTRKLHQLACKEMVKSFCNYPKFPWKVELASKEDIDQYNAFINIKAKCDSTYGFATTKQTGSKYNPESIGILSIPQNYDMQTDIVSLPCRVEQYAVAYPIDKKLKDIKFIIDGKYKVTHLFATDDMYASDIFENTKEEKSFYATLDIISQFPDDVHELNKDKMKEIQIETLASLNVSVFENVVLTALGSVAEECNMALKDLCGKKRDDYFYQAERKKLIPSASQFQKYLNVRNLMHHQWASLEGLSCFDTEEHEQNKSMRKRYMQSYQEICEKRLADRIDAYQSAIQNISTLVAEINPNLFIRGQNESNSKFISRIKEYAKENPKENIYVQTNYRTKHDKINSIAKTLLKVAPNAQIIDKPLEKNDKFMELVRNFLYRKKYLETVQYAEHIMVKYSLYSGKNLVPTSALIYLKNKKIITPDEAQRWTEYKKLRNDLSHKYLDDNLLKQMNSTQADFYEEAYKIIERVNNLIPDARCLGGDTYEVLHKNGKRVVLDFNQKQVLSITDAKGKELLKEKTEKRNSHTTYVEEHTNGISFTLSGTEIKGIRINDINIDFTSPCLRNSDDVKMYLGAANRNYINGQNSTKIVTDKKFNISNLVRHKKSQTVEKNEVITLHGSHKVSVGKNKQLEKYIWSDENKTQQSITFSVKNGKTILSFSDGTVWEFDKKSNKLSHNGMVLTYKNRKKFAESYNDGPTFPTNSNSGNGR